MSAFSDLERGDQRDGRDGRKDKNPRTSEP